MEVDTAKRTGTAFCRKHCISIQRQQWPSKRLWLKPLQGTLTISLQRSLPVPSPEPLRGCGGSAQNGFACWGRLPSWDYSCSYTLLSPVLQLLLRDFGRASLCLSFPNCEVEKRIFHFAEIFLLQEAVSVNTVFISKTPPLMLALSLQLTLQLFYSWNGIYANKNNVAAFGN